MCFVGGDFFIFIFLLCFVLFFIFQHFHGVDLTVINVIRREKEMSPLNTFGVQVEENQALKVGGAELINKTLVGGRTSPLGSSKRISSIEGTAVKEDGINN